MLFLTYIVFGAAIQIIIMVERWIRLPIIRELVKDRLGEWKFWVLLSLFMIINIISWPFAIYCEIRLIQNGT